MKATLKSIPVTEVTQGIYVCWEGATRIHFGLVEIIKDKVYATISLLSTNGHDTVPIDILKTIVVEYEQDVNYINIVSPLHNYKQIPLKDQDWQQAIDLGLVDSGKEVDVKIVTITGKGHGSRDVFAKLVTQQRDYTDIVELGDGAGQLFVKGSYDAIKTLQSKMNQKTAVEWLIDWMDKNQYFIGNDLLDAVEKAKQIELSKRESSFVEGYKARALGSNQIFDSASESYARMLFNEQ